MALIDKLTAIGDGFRTSRGVSDKFTLDQMATMAAEPNIDALIERSITEVNRNVKSVAEYAFYDYANLVTVNFPIVTSIGYGAFQNCSQLTHVEFPMVTSIGNYAFQSCSQLTHIEFPMVTSIGSGAFSYCTSLTELILRNETMCILNGKLALDEGFIKRCHIYVPSALKDAYKSAANWKTYRNRIRALEEYTIDGTITGALDPEKTSQEDPFTGVVLEVEKITSDTYSSANSESYTGESFILLDIYPKTNGSVYVNYGNSSKSVTDTFGATNPAPEKISFGTFNGAGGFVSTPSSGTLTIEGDCKSFGVGTFSVTKTKTDYCDCITAVRSLGDITTIVDDAFHGCAGITSVTIPDSITSIGSNAFEGCTGLTSVSFDNTDGWFVADSASATSGTPVDVTDPVANVTLLNDTYKTYYWKRA